MTAYHFPPLGGGGMLRALKLARYLPASGWRPTVLSADDPAFHLRDPAALDEVDCPVIRTPARRYPSLGRLLRLSGATAVRRNSGGTFPGGGALRTRLRRFAARLGDLPDAQGRWARGAAATAVALQHQRPHDLIWTTGPPHSSHLVGLRLKERYAAPWVVDLRDSWTVGPFFEPISGFHRALARRLERRVVEAADALVCVSPSMAELYRKAFPAAADKLKVITNGYDEADFAGLEQLKPEPASVGYAGSFYGPRRPDAFLAALTRLHGKHPALRWRFIGSAGPEAAAAIDGCSKAHPGLLECRGSLPHRAALSELARCAMLLLVIAPQPGAQTVLTGKLFEYLRLGRPILACCPPGDAARLIADLNAGIVADPTDPSAIARALAALLDEPPPPVSRSAVEPYERRRLAERTARLFNELVDD